MAANLAGFVGRLVCLLVCPSLFPKSDRSYIFTLPLLEQLLNSSTKLLRKTLMRVERGFIRKRMEGEGVGALYTQEYLVVGRGVVGE